MTQGLPEGTVTILFTDVVGSTELRTTSPRPSTPRQALGAALAGERLMAHPEIGPPAHTPPVSREASPDGLRSSCSRCGAELRRSAYEVRLTRTGAYHCLRCAVIHWPTVRRSFLISLIVGTLLTAINQGTLLVQGDLPARLAWQVPLTYVVPYCVATIGAVLNARRSVGAELDSA